MQESELFFDAGLDRWNRPENTREIRFYAHVCYATALSLIALMVPNSRVTMTLHGIENPDIRYKDSLSQKHAGDTDRYCLVLVQMEFRAAPFLQGNGFLQAAVSRKQGSSFRA